MSKQYITPTKERPVFKALCRDFGFIEDNLYKEWNIISDKCNMVGSTYALSLADAVTKLLEFIPTYESINSKSKFEIIMIDGTVNKYGEPIEVTAFSINFKQSKKFRIIK